MLVSVPSDQQSKDKRYCSHFAQIAFYLTGKFGPVSMKIAFMPLVIRYLASKHSNGRLHVFISFQSVFGEK